MAKISSKNRIAFASLILFSLIFLSFGYAASFNAIVTPTSINEDTEVLLNFTISNTETTNVNITQVNITLPTGFSFVDGTNGTTAANTTFSNTTTILNWTNTTPEGFIENGTTRYFWFKVNATVPGKYNITINTSDTSGSPSSKNVTITVDNKTAPEITLISPDNKTITNSIDIDFNFTASDAFSTTLSCSLIINGTINKTNSSVVNGTETNFTLSELSDGDYLWSVNCTDEAGNEGASETRILTVDTIAPEITEVTLNDTSPVKAGNVTFNLTFNEVMNASITPVVKINGTVINETGWENDNKTWLGWYNFTTSDGDGNYTINVTGAKDIAGNEMVENTSNWFILDTTAPEITLISPADLTSSTTNAYNFTFNVADANNVSNCSLIFDGLIVKNLTEVNTSETNGIYYSSLSIGTHTWSINCTDVAKNVGNSPTRTLIVRAPSSSSSGTTYPTYRIDDEELSKGYQKVMRKNWRILFRIDGESHTFKVEDITETTAKISISSETQEAILSIGEEKKFEITGDNYYDILVRLNSIDSTNEIYLKADFTIQSIHEEIIPLEEEEEITETNETEEIIEEPIEEEPIEEEETIPEEIPEEVEEEINETIEEEIPETIPEQEERTNITALWITIIFIIVILIILILIHRRSKKE